MKFRTRNDLGSVLRPFPWLGLKAPDSPEREWIHRLLTDSVPARLVARLRRFTARMQQNGSKPAKKPCGCPEIDRGVEEQRKGGAMKAIRRLLLLMTAAVGVLAGGCVVHDPGPFHHHGPHCGHPVYMNMGFDLHHHHHR